MTKNPLKLKKTNNLPFFGIIEKGDSLLTTISFLKIFIFSNNITSFIKFKNRSTDKNEVDIPLTSPKDMLVRSVNQKIFKDSTQIVTSLTPFSNICLYDRFITAPSNISTYDTTLLTFLRNVTERSLGRVNKVQTQEGDVEMLESDVHMSKYQQKAEFISLKDKRLISNILFNNLPDTKNDVKYDPNQNFIKIQKVFHKKKNFGNIASLTNLRQHFVEVSVSPINQSSFFLINCSIFYFLPFWAVAFPINFFSNFYTFYITKISALRRQDILFKNVRSKTSLADIPERNVRSKNICFDPADPLEEIKKDVSDVMPASLLTPLSSADIPKGDGRQTPLGFKKGEKDMSGVDKLGVFNPSIFFSNYRKKIKTSITNHSKQLDDIQFIITLFPFVFSFLLLIRSRYKKQFFSYFVKETLPGFSLPHQNISWETFNEITSQKIVSNQNFEQYSSFNITAVDIPQSNVNKVQALEGEKGDVSNISEKCQHIENKKKQTHFFNTPNNKTNFVTSTLPKTRSNVSNTSPDLIERLDIYSNFILLEMNPVWEEQQKQLYIGFLPKKSDVSAEQITFSPFLCDANSNFAQGSDVQMSTNYKAKNGTSAFSDLTNPRFFTEKQNTIETNLPFMKDEGLVRQTKSNESGTSSPSKLYARKPSFLSFSKKKISLEKKSIDQRVKLNNVFSKQYFQQKFVDLDELPLKLDQNYSIDFLSENHLFLISPLEMVEGKSNDCDKTYLLNTLFNYNVKQNLPNLLNVKEIKNTFSLHNIPYLHPERDCSAQDVTTKNNQIDLILPFKSEVSSRFLSGYRFPDTGRARIDSLFIQNVYKDFVFQKANKKNLKMIIQVPSSFVYDFLNENDSSVLHLTSPPVIRQHRSLCEANPSEFASNIPDADILTSPKVMSKEDVTQLNFNYLPASQNVLNKVLIEKSNIGGIYQKIFTIYKADQTVTSLPSDISAVDIPFRNVRSKTSLPGKEKLLAPLKPFRDITFLHPERANITFLHPERVSDVKYVKVFLTPLLALSKSSTLLKAQSFRESWEPVTFQSWLAITKLSFTFFVLKFLQYFYTNYGRDLLIIVLRFLDENLKEGLGLTNKKKDKGYRLIKKVKKAFKDVAGIDNILPELGEMVWVLRNSGNGATTFKFGNLLPKGFLFVGPPGTGKTFLVQAIAGEAGVPVLVQSRSSLTDAGENDKGAQRLKSLFKKARQLAPCIVFIDEIDTLGETRQNVMRNPDAQQGTDDLIQSLHKYNKSSNILTDERSSPEHSKGMSGVFSKPLEKLKLSVKKSGNIAEKQNKSNINVSEKFQDTQKNQEKQKANQEQLNLLMQLLIELDGLKSRKGVIVIGATNRPRVLDPALTRPGRFDRVLNLEFPGKKKRIEILKLYSQNIGLADILTDYTLKGVRSFPEYSKGVSGVFVNPFLYGAGAPKKQFSSASTLCEANPEGFASHKEQCRQIYGRDVLLHTTEMLEDDGKSSVSFYDKAFSSFAEEPLTPLDTTQKDVKSHKLLTAEQGQSSNQLDSFFNLLKSLPKKEYKEIQKSFLQPSNLGKPKNKRNVLPRIKVLPLKGDIKSLTNTPQGCKSVKGRVSGLTKSEFPWEYLANRTFGFSAADLAAAMNQSSIQAILRRTGHTIETIEQGIEFITSYSIEKPKIDSQKSQETFSCLTSDLNSNVALTNTSTILTSLLCAQGKKVTCSTLTSDTPLHPERVLERVKEVICQHRSLHPQGLASKISDTDILTSPKVMLKGDVMERNVNKVQAQESYLPTLLLLPSKSSKVDLAQGTGTKKDVKERLVKESKTILQIPSLLFDVRLPKALSFQKSKDKKDPFFITRFAYYQAGKGILHTLLPEHPDVIILKLWPQPKNSRHRDANFQLTSIDHRAKLETRLIGLYAGKAAELLFLCLNSHIKKENLFLSLLEIEKTGEIASCADQTTDILTLLLWVTKAELLVTSPRTKKKVFVNPLEMLGGDVSDVKYQIKKKLNEKVDFSLYEKRNLWHSNLGIDELSIASNLAHSLVDKWFFYSNKITLRKENQIFTNQNTLEFSKIELVDLFQQLTEEVQKLVSASNISESSMRDGRDKHFRSNFQEWSIRPWWQNQITKETGNLNMFYDDWYRIYLPDPEESERNEEWVIPDEYYHNTQNLKNILPFFGTKLSKQGNFDYGFSKNKRATCPSNIWTSDTPLDPERRVKKIHRSLLLRRIEANPEGFASNTPFRNVNKVQAQEGDVCMSKKEIKSNNLSSNIAFGDLLLSDQKSCFKKKQQTHGKERRNILQLDPDTSLGIKNKIKKQKILETPQTKPKVLSVPTPDTLKGVRSGVDKSQRLTKTQFLSVRGNIASNSFKEDVRCQTKNFQTKNELYVDITWNDLYKIDRDYIYHALILTCFNKAFSLLDENRELLDYLADYLMRFETVRQHKIKEIICDFGDFSLTPPKVI